MDIQDHLKLYNLKEFDSFEEISEYAVDLAEKFNIPKKVFNKLNNREKNSWTDAQHLQFYNTVSSSPFLREIIYSEKYDAYVECANVVMENISSDPRKILDIGCSCGYITTWYAKYFPSATIVGIDNAAQSIRVANEYSISIGINNAHFQVMDMNKLKFEASSFDNIVDTQSIYYSDNILNVLKRIKNILTDDGCLITIPSIGEYDYLVEYAETILKSGLAIKTAEFIPFTILGDIQFNMVFVVDKVSSSKQIDFREKWEFVRSLMSN